MRNANCMCAEYLLIHVVVYLPILWENLSQFFHLFLPSFSATHIQTHSPKEFFSTSVYLFYSSSRCYRWLDVSVLVNYLHCSHLQSLFQRHTSSQVVVCQHLNVTIYGKPLNACGKRKFETHNCYNLLVDKVALFYKAKVSLIPVDWSWYRMPAVTAKPPSHLMICMGGNILYM